MCTTQRLTTTDKNGNEVVVEDTQDCGKKTCPYSVYYDPED